MTLTKEQMDAARAAWREYAKAAEISQKGDDAKTEYVDAVYEAYVAGFSDGKAAAALESK